VQPTKVLTVSDLPALRRYLYTGIQAKLTLSTRTMMRTILSLMITGGVRLPEAQSRASYFPDHA
jgi:hypothetical protein